jgi:regulatory protein
VGQGRPQSVTSSTDERLQRALELAYDYLNRRDRTSAEVRRRLDRDGIGVPATEEALRILMDQGYVDDARLAQLLMADKQELEQWGSDRIRRMLLARGINHELVEQTLRAESGEIELDRALGLLRRRFPSPPQDRRERDRAFGVLLRKGYDSELASVALAAYARDAAPPDLR